MQYIPHARSIWSRHDLENKFRSHSIHYPKGYGLFVIEELSTRQLIGEAGLFNTMNDECVLELGYILDHHFWGKGYGTEVCRALINHSFYQLNVKQVIARMYKANKASARLAEKCGMHLDMIEANGEGNCVLQYIITNVRRAH